MIVVGLSHRNTPIAVRERLAVSGDGLRDLLERMHRLAQVGEVMMVSTCNRVEIYATASNDTVTAETLSRAIVSVLAELGGADVVPHLSTAVEQRCVLHLFRVAASLDSLVVGEPQILGQLKEAVREAQQAQTLGPELYAAARAAVHVAKRVRTETGIGAGQVSVPSVAVDLAHQIFDDLEQHRCLLVGAGEMAEAAAKLLARAGSALLVVNRSAERAEQLASAVGGQPRKWTELEQSLIEADIVIASTASKVPVITHELLRGMRRKRRGRSLFLIDIAVPRDVEASVNNLDNVYLYDIDDLSHVVAQSLEDRAVEAKLAESIVRQEVGNFEARRSQQAVKPVIVGLRQHAQDVLTTELERSLKGRLKHLPEQDRNALSTMIGAAVNKLLHTPTMRLKQLAEKQRARHAARILCDLFALEDEVIEGLLRGQGTRQSLPPLSQRDESEATETAPDEQEQEQEEDGTDPLDEPRVAIR